MACPSTAQSMRYAMSTRSCAWWIFVGLLAALLPPTLVRAQDLVPGAYTPAPIGFTLLNIAGVFSDGAIAFDPALPIDDAHSTVGGVAVGIARTLNLGGRFASVGAAIPVVLGHVEGLVFEQFQEVSRAGQADLAARVAINLYGAPAMTLKEFAAYRATTIVGVSLTVGAPVGQYDSTKYINLGNNRWTFKPEVGISRTRGPWTFEGDIGALFFTDNTNYVNSATRQQAPIVGLQGHLIRTFRPGFWIAADGNYWKGGRVTTNGTSQVSEQENSRIGATLAYPIRRHQFRFSYSFGAYTTIGGDFQSVGTSYTYAWVSRQ
jgi:Putative MetA-pathway of phenol degradation